LRLCADVYHTPGKQLCIIEWLLLGDPGLGYMGGSSSWYEWDSVLDVGSILWKSCFSNCWKTSFSSKQ